MPQLGEREEQLKQQPLDMGASLEEVETISPSSVSDYGVPAKKATEEEIGYREEDFQDQGFSEVGQEDMGYPLDSEQQEDLSTVLAEEPVESELYSSEMNARYASLSDDPFSSYGQSMQKGGLWSAQQINDTARELSFSITAEAVETAAKEGESIDPEAIQSIIDEEQSLFEAETGPEYAWASTVPGFYEVDEETQKAIIVDRYINRKLGELLSDKGVLSWAGDVAGLLLVPDEAYNAAMFWEGLTGDEGAVENWWNSEEGMAKVSNWFSNLSPEDKVEVLPAILKAAKDVDDNEIQQIILAMYATGKIPRGELELDMVLDKLTVIGAVGNTMVKLPRVASIAKSLSKLGKNREVAALADGVLKGNIKPIDAQMHAHDAASSGLPIVSNDLARLLDSAPESMASKIREEWALMDAIKAEGLDIVTDGISPNANEIAAVVDREMAKLNSMPNIENLSFNVQKDGVEFTYDIVKRNDITGKLEGTLGEKKKIKYKQSDLTDSYEQKELGPISDVFSTVVSPNAMFNKLRDVLVQPFELAATSQAKLRSRLTDTLRVATQTLKSDKVALQRVGDLLLRGTMNDTVYSYQKAVNKGIGGVRYTDNEYKTYLNIRKLYDDMYFLKNDEIKKKLELRGAKFVTLSNGQTGFPSVADTPSGAWKKYIHSKYKNVIDDDSGSIISLSKEELEAAYDEGKVLVRLDNNSEFFFSGDTKAKFALVRDDNIADIPELVLQYRQGYSPLLYQNANFFVKVKRSVDDIANGQLKYNETLRVFDNYTDAESFAKDYATKNNLTFGEDVLAPFNREKMSDSDIEEDIINMYGGFAASPRKSERLPFGKDGVEASFVDPIEALQQYMFHVGNRIPITELRLANEQRWLNSAKEALGDSFKNDFNEMYGVLKSNTSIGEAKKNFLIRSHEQISTLNHIPTDGEQVLQGKLISVGKALESKSPSLKGISKHMYTLAQNNPIGAIKSSVHHMFLGTLSLAQYPVQALGATVAMSINPKYAIKGMGKFFAFTYLDNIIDASHRASAMKTLAKTQGLNLSDIEEAYSLWRKSGYRESALITSGDYATLAHGLPYDGGVISRLFDKSAFPFKAGELVNMRISFATAYERWKDLNKGKPLDDDALKQIFARAEQFRLNMSQGNKARFQKGIVSVPLQFQQINTKFVEAVLGDTFTPKEKRNLLIGQLTLFGAMGVPFGEALVEFVYDLMDIETADMSEEEINIRKRGLMGYFINNYLGRDAEVSGRVAIPAGFSDMLLEGLFEKHDIVSLAGPFGGLVNRGLDTFSGIWNAGKLAYTADDLTKEDMAGITSMMVQSVLELPSGTRNMLLAYDLYKGNMVTDRFGRPMWASDPSGWDVLFQAVGFQGLTKSEYWELVNSSKARQQSEKAMVDRLTWLYTRALRGVEEGDPQATRYANLVTSHIYSQIEDKETAERIHKKLMDRFRGNDQLLDLIQKELLYSSDKFTGEPLNLLKSKAQEGDF